MIETMYFLHARIVLSAFDLLHFAEWLSACVN